MSTGKLYIEAMVEQITALALPGTLSVAGNTDLSAGAVTYQRSMALHSTNTTYGDSDSGKCLVVNATNTTASLPDCTALANAGQTYTFIMLGAHNLKITASAGGAFLGTIDGILTASNDAAGGTGVVSAGTAAGIQCLAGTAGDRVTVLNTGLSYYVMLNSQVYNTNSKWSFTDD
tara:strand:+ start:219 stop:743 length:525 start_codon:yes stop_codon:yes gene_type:complete